MVLSSAFIDFRAFEIRLEITLTNEGNVEYWFARDLMRLLGYSEWRNFEKATEMTNYNVEDKDLYGEATITDEHVQNNTEIRNMLGSRGIKPEELPVAEDIKKLERKAKSQDKKMIEAADGFCKTSK